MVAGGAVQAAAARQGVPAAGMVQLASSVILLSSAWPITKTALAAGAPPLWFAVGRAGFSGLIAFAVLGLLGRLRLPGRQDMPTLLAVGLLQLAGFFAFAHAAVAWVPAGRTAILCNVTTIWIVPLSLLVLREAIPPRRWIAAALGVGGTVVLMGPWAIDWSVRDVLVGHVFLLAAAFCFALAMTVVRAAPPRLSMLQLLPWCFAIGTAALVPLALWRGGGIGAWPAPVVWSIAYIGLLAGPVGTWCVMQVAATLPAMVASVGFLMTPAAGLALSTWWLGEPLGSDLLLGSALILGGVGCAAWPQRK
ncbi:DMT family transporter [Limobrevibacterium gyesilva]|uniref:DMT family transporter n=1 Tax=Limobrevibacterium gyesilva TaxID=2991712 RepID=A0AA41YQS1_9PROT|nr:DMT family transporter [Limobrevibacterium gyesilva]MCW3477135.1 DMT family transporter [Limobrevibacterium gyesilva]